MADNFIANPGAGGATFASDEIAGVQHPRFKAQFGDDGSAIDVSASNPLPVTVGLTDAQLRASAVPVSGTVTANTGLSQPLTDSELRAALLAVLPSAKNADFWPSYGGPSSVGASELTTDPGGALITRGAILTDEGTFRINFANTSLAVTLGSVTVAGATVTGSGFISNTTRDVHSGDYFKLDADPESAWMQIDSIDSDTQMTLRLPYVGGASGAASRALMRPQTGAGGSIAVASGQCTLTSGTTANANTLIIRAVDFAPLVYRGAFSVSQRIVNQTIYAGLTEQFTLNDRWFARFRIDGTVNTTVICESARNPTTTPSAAETQTTTVTLPNAGTTAQVNEYRVELLTERVIFYINGVKVAEHTRAIPSQHDEMEAAVRILNGATPPATSTTVVCDYVTGKNHNKLEVGIMSDSEQIVAQQPDLTPFAFNFTGVIAINTVLLEIDCLRFRSLSIQASGIGTTGVVTPEWSNNRVSWQTASLSQQTGAAITTFSAAGLWTAPVIARYFRLRLSTATTAGSTTLDVAAYAQSAGFLPTQPVSGTVAGTGNFNVAAQAGTNRIGSFAAPGIWYDDSATVLAAAATFTGVSRDLTVTGTATAITNAAAYFQELRVSAESDQSGTLWVEYSRDNTNWRRARSVATVAVTGGGQFAEIVVRPSWRYARVGFTNGATLQTRFTIGSILTAV